tara:strand:+ start:37 stop:339 length:303 start_codon:yes stop_codon:yes gene_type:complete
MVNHYRLKASQTKNLVIFVMLFLALVFVKNAALIHVIAKTIRQTNRVANATNLLASALMNLVITAVIDPVAVMTVVKTNLTDQRKYSSPLKMAKYAKFNT